jgi:hypothetical protein
MRSAESSDFKMTRLQEFASPGVSEEYEWATKFNIGSFYLRRVCRHAAIVMWLCRLTASSPPSKP